MKRSPILALPLLAAGLGACAPDAPTTAAAPPPTLDAVAVPGAWSPQLGLQIAIDDAGTRVIPTLGDAAEARAVGAAFASLGAAVRLGDAAAAREAAAGARAALEALQAAAPEADPVELAGLALVLDGADALYPARP